MAIGITLPKLKGENNMARKKPHIMIRFLLQLVSFMLCLVLTVCLLTTALLLDLKSLTSAGGIQAIVTALTSGSVGLSVPQQDEAVVDGYVVSLANQSIPDGDRDLPQEAMTDSNFMTDYIYDILQGSTDKNISRSEVSDFVNDSTIMDFTSEKMASYVQDAMNGEETTTISADEIVKLLEENQALLEERFDIKLTDEMKSKIRAQAQKAIEEDDLNGTIRQSINEMLDQPIDGTDMTINDLFRKIGELTSTQSILSAVGLCLLLVLLLFLANFYKLPKGLTWASVPFLMVGLPMAAIISGMKEGGFVQNLIGNDAGGVSSLLGSLADVLAPVHYGIAAMGIAMLVGSIVWRILARVLPRRRARA